MILKYSELKYLQRFCEEENNFSLIKQLNVNPSDDDKESLLEQGFLEGDDLSKELKMILKILSTPTRFSKLALQQGDLSIEKYTYYKDDEILLVENMGKGLRLSLTDDISSATDELINFIGMSEIVTAMVEIKLNSLELMVLLMVVDIYRKKSMLNYWDIEINESVMFSDLIELLNNSPKASLTNLFNKIYRFEVPKVEQIKPILDGLIEKEVLSFDDGYYLSGEYASVAANFEVLKTSIICENYQQVNDKDFKYISTIFIVASINDILCVSRSSDTVEFSSVSSSFVMDFIDRCLGCPELG